MSQAFIHGFNKPFNVALIVPDRAALEKWAGQRRLASDFEPLLEDDKIRKLFEVELEEHSQDFKGYERIRRFKLIPEEFSVDNGMLTPKMSLKRNVVLDRYQSELEQLHAT